MEQLHPGARWAFRFRGYLVSLVLLWFLGWFIAFPLFGILGSNLNSVGTVLGLGVFFIFLYIVAVIVVGEIYACMSYNRWFFDFTDSNLKVERGIIWKKYSNIPYERVQNVDISRGILARILGYSTVMIQTAGYSYAPRGGGMAIEGYLPAVSIERAEQIRDFLMKKITKRGRSQGL